jgi:hypothetical protein
MSDTTFTFGKMYDETKVPVDIDATGALNSLVKGAYENMVRMWSSRRIKAATYRQNVAFDGKTYQVIFDTRQP